MSKAHYSIYRRQQMFDNSSKQIDFISYANQENAQEQIVLQKIRAALVPEPQVLPPDLIQFNPHLDSSRKFYLKNELSINSKMVAKCKVAPFQGDHRQRFLRMKWK
ncbi:Hypothetical_protein [Hexamita inflata]|uniref:Hypothetical_protein n=1 Tax=Hexamita inflata TaxID=28002 RepID=A0AA86PV30_9EUKA|nr:Hypothetical protein HINF_LOCUS34131 [Hexamita inflata]CAI9973235.1 Hypothetical protein HINF_LOCUS60880 [Hexamita inflata]